MTLIPLSQPVKYIESHLAVLLFQLLRMVSISLCWNLSSCACKPIYYDCDLFLLIMIILSRNLLFKLLHIHIINNYKELNPWINNLHIFYHKY